MGGWCQRAMSGRAAAIQECLDTPLEKLQKMSDAGYRKPPCLHNIDSEAKALASLFGAKLLSRL